MGEGVLVGEGFEGLALAGIVPQQQRTQSGALPSWWLTFHGACCSPFDSPTQVIASRPNVCKQLHMPAQSGSSAVLERMRRGYTREAYDALVRHVRNAIPEVALRWVRVRGVWVVGWSCDAGGGAAGRRAWPTCVPSAHYPHAHRLRRLPCWMLPHPPPRPAPSTDMIAGFCGEGEEDHAASLDLVRSAGYDQAFLFAYSMRGKTHAARHYQVHGQGGRVVEACVLCVCVCVCVCVCARGGWWVGGGLVVARHKAAEPAWAADLWGMLAVEGHAASRRAVPTQH